MSADDDRIGQVLGARYRVVRPLGTGGMGTVYEGEPIDGGPSVALKVLHAHLAREGEAVGRFRREAQAASALGHPGIVDVHDFGIDPDGTVWMALEHLRGRDLAAVLKAEGPMRVGRAVRLVAQVCEALATAHERGIIHRDLKPENIFLLEGEERVKILDFGISKFASVEGAPQHTMTRTGTTIGTPYFMAPEQAQGLKDIDRRVDVYATGVLLFRMLTGQHPFEDSSYPMLVLKICTEPPPPVRAYRADVPSSMQAAIEAMLEKDASERPADMAAVRDSILPFAGHDVDPIVVDAPAIAARRPSALGATARLQTSAPTGGEAPAERASEPPPPPPATAGGGVAKWILIGTAVATLAAVAALAATGGDPDRPAPPALPEPRPPVIRPLVTPSTGGVGWSWVNPLPRAMPTWYGVHVGGPGLVGLVGHGGNAARYEGGLLVRFRTGTESHLRGLAWMGRQEALAVGDDGAMRILRAGDPVTLDAGTSSTLRAVVALTPTAALVVGDGGAALRVSGQRVERIDSGTTHDLLALHRRGDLAWAVGAGGTILRYEGGRFVAETSGTQVTLRAVGGCPGGPVYASGEGGKVFRRTRDGAWRPLVGVGGEAWLGVCCDGELAVSVGREGGVLLMSGDRSVRLDSGTDRALRAVSGADGERTWIVGDSGRMAVLADARVQTLTAGSTAPILDMTALAGRLVAVGEWGRVLREDAQGRFVETESPTRSALAGVTPLAEDVLVAVGDLGAVLEIRFDSERLVESPSDDSFRDVVSADGELLAVGSRGAILRGAPGALRLSRVADTGTLWGLAGVPGDAIAVGDAGVVLRIGAEDTSRLACDVGGVTLRGVLRTGDGTWVVGDEGKIARLDGDGCAIEHRGGPTLNAVERGPNGRLLAVGDRGAALERGDDGTWAPSSLDVGGMDLRAVTRTDRSVYALGAGGVIVRHVRLD